MRQIDRDAYRDWDAYKYTIYHETPVDKAMSKADIERHRIWLEEHPLEWIKFFFPGYAKYEFADFQMRAIRRIISNDEWYEVLSWSRELAKSTCVMFIVFYLVLTGKKKNILLISNSLDNARRLLDPYRVNFEANQRIEAYYGKQQTLGSWTDSEFILKCGASFRALGAGQSPRGTRNEAARPDVLLFDDFDTDEECLNPDTINKKWDWVERSAYPTRSISEPMLVVWCGNIIAKDCCVVRAGKAADHWDIVNIRDKEGRSTWPEKNSEEHIDRTLSKISTKAAQGEYFNNPISEGEVFKSVTYGKIPPLRRFKYLVIYGDPSNSENKTKRNSTKAVILLGKVSGRLYVIGCRLDRASSAEFIQWYVDMLQMTEGRSNVYCYMENNSLQDPFFQQVFQPHVRELRKRQGIDLYIRGDEEKKTDKATRIEANLEPMNREGNLVLNEALRDDPHMKRLEEQFLLFTMRLKFPADGPDCVEGGNRKLNELQASMEPPVIITSRQTRKRNKYRL
ncbi:MAG: hypothetical protein IJ190_10410 [Prevotella sp.]|nr:hypothetical protein [Prevotella sp.]